MSKKSSNIRSHALAFGMPLIEEYEEEIKRQTKTKSIEEALEKLQSIR